MCIGVCIGLFFDFNLFNKINELVLFVDSYYRTISNSSQVYRNQRKPRLLRFSVRILFFLGNLPHVLRIAILGW